MDPKFDLSHKMSPSEGVIVSLSRRHMLLDVHQARQSAQLLNVTNRYSSLPPIILVLSTYAAF